MGLSNLGLIGLLILTTIIFVVIMMFFERYFGNKNNKQLMRIMLLTLLLSVNILIFLIFSFSTVKFKPGVQGPKGLKGRVGPMGKESNIAECTKKYETLGDAYMNLNKQKSKYKFKKPLLR